jgi:hypothetical protein
MGNEVTAVAPPGRAKSKTESGVKYVKRNAIAGRQFESFAHLEAHLAEMTARSRPARPRHDA